jgi:hypothetical protein
LSGIPDEVIVGILLAGLVARQLAISRTSSRVPLIVSRKPLRISFCIFLESLNLSIAHEQCKNKCVHRVSKLIDVTPQFFVFGIKDKKFG